MLAGAQRVGRRAARERAESKWRLHKFLAAVGHELRNPLTTVSGYAELARTDGASYEPVRQEALGRVAAEVRRMDSLIDELVLLSRLDLGQPLHLDSVDLAQPCRDAVEAERDCHPEHRVRLLVAPGKHTVIGDPLRLHQVVANLLTNARVHTPEGTTTLGLGTEDGHRVIEVTDDGPGVPDNLRARIFDRFVRGEDTQATGSGLGLGHRHSAWGGSVTLELSDRGAWFRVRLPTPPHRPYPPLTVHPSPFTGEGISERIPMRFRSHRYLRPVGWNRVLRVPPFRYRNPRLAGPAPCPGRRLIGRRRTDGSSVRYPGMCWAGLSSGGFCRSSSRCRWTCWSAPSRRPGTRWRNPASAGPSSRVCVTSSTRPHW